MNKKKKKLSHVLTMLSSWSYKGVFVFQSQFPQLSVILLLLSEKNNVLNRKFSVTQSEKNEKCCTIDLFPMTRS